MFSQNGYRVPYLWRTCCYPHLNVGPNSPCENECLSFNLCPKHTFPFTLQVFPKLLFRGISILYHPSSDITMIIISVKGIEEEKRQRGHSGWRPTRGLWKVRRNILTEWIEMEKYLDENFGPLSWVEVAHSLSSFACS